MGSNMVWAFPTPQFHNSKLFDAFAHEPSVFCSMTGELCGGKWWRPCVQWGCARFFGVGTRLHGMGLSECVSTTTLWEGACHWCTAFAESMPAIWRRCGRLFGAHDGHFFPPPCPSMRWHSKLWERTRFGLLQPQGTVEIGAQQCMDVVNVVLVVLCLLPSMRWHRQLWNTWGRTRFGLSQPHIGSPSSLMERHTATCPACERWIGTLEQDLSQVTRFPRFVQGFSVVIVVDPRRHAGGRHGGGGNVRDIATWRMVQAHGHIFSAGCLVPDGY